MDPFDILLRKVGSAEELKYLMHNSKMSVSMLRDLYSPFMNKFMGEWMQCNQSFIVEVRPANAAAGAHPYNISTNGWYQH